MKWISRGLFIFTCTLFLSGCFDVVEYLFGDNNATSITLVFDKPAGHYDNIPSPIDITFPTTVDMSTVASADFTISDTCTVGTAAISGFSITGDVVTLTLNGVTGCAETEYVTLVINYDQIELDNRGQYLSGTASFRYTVDTTAPTVSATINTISGIVASGNYAFTSVPSSVTFIFSSDIDMNSIAATDFSIGSYGTDCLSMPTIGTLTKVSSQYRVTVPLSGASCADGESFMISLAANSVADGTRDSSTGASNPFTTPAASLDISITRIASGASVLTVGNYSTSATGTYSIGDPVDIDVEFDTPVDVTGTPRLQMNITGGSTRYALYTSGSTTNILTFSYTVAIGDTAADLNYSSTSALQLNGGTISLNGSGGGIAATRTLPSPGSVNSLGFNRDIVIDTDVPTITTSSPTGPTNTWGLSSRTVTFTFSKTLDPASIDDTDLTITPGTCAGVPTVLSSSLTGGSNNIVVFSLSSNTCADGEDYDLTLDPTLVYDLSANSGYGSPRNISVTTETSVPVVSVSAPSRYYVNASNNLTYTVTYSGASSITLSNTDVNFAGNSTGCTANVTGSGTTTRTITITGCSDDGSVQIDLATDTAINTYGNFAAAVPEASITDFNADNTPLTDPTLSLPTYGPNLVYDIDSESNFILTFTADDLGTSGAIQSALSLNCDTGGGPNTVGFTATRTSATVATVTPNESSPDFSYNADCVIDGSNVPDSAGNLFTFTTGLNFKVGRTLTALSGPTGTISLATATGAGDLGSVIFNVATDTATINAVNVTLDCNGNNIDITSLPPTAGDTDILIDFDESDPDWTILTGGENCSLTFSTSVQNSLGMPLLSPVAFNFTTSP